MKQSRRLILFFLLALAGLLYFVAGFHNVDLAYNVAHAGLKVIDCNSFICQTMEQGYTRGITMMFIGFFTYLFLFIYLLYKYLKIAVYIE